jgi:hypothetical protein
VLTAFLVERGYRRDPKQHGKTIKTKFECKPVKLYSTDTDGHLSNNELWKAANISVRALTASSLPRCHHLCVLPLSFDCNLALDRRMSLKCSIAGSVLLVGFLNDSFEQLFVNISSPTSVLEFLAQ